MRAFFIGGSLGILFIFLIAAFSYPADTGHENVYLAQHNSEHDNPAIQELNARLAEIKDKIAQNHKRQEELAKLKEQLIEDITAAYDANTQIALRKEFHRTEAREYAVQRSLHGLLKQKQGLETKLLSVEGAESP